MGYQLWTSPITGYRRHGTRLSDFNEALGDRLIARDICEPLQSCPSNAPSLAMADILLRREFDVAGVRDVCMGPVVGWVAQEDLMVGQVSDHVRAIDDDDVTDALTPLRRLFELFKKRAFLFVRTDGDLSYILTRADLNKPIVRVYLFGLISLLEIHLGFWVANLYPKDTWMDRLTVERLQRAEIFQENRASAGQMLDLIQCLQFCDKQKILVGHAGIRDALQLGSKSAAKDLLSDVEELRNSLAHSQYDLIAGGSWESLIALVERVQSIIDISDRRVEKEAVAIAVDDIGALW